MPTDPKRLGNRQIAQAFADELFRDSDPKRPLATRLVIETADRPIENRSGWCKEAIRDRLEDLLNSLTKKPRGNK